MKNNNQNLSDLYEKLLSQNMVTMKNVYDYADSHYDELMDMKRIFDLETEEHINCCLVIPKLLDPLAAEDIIAYFRSEHPDNSVLAKNNPDFQQYKVLLLSAFIYNPSFFAMAWNWCGLIRQEIQLQARKQENNRNKFEIVKGGTTTGTSGITSSTLPFQGKVQKPLSQLRAASGKDKIRKVHEWNVDDSNDVFLGHLRIVVVNDVVVKFNFKFDQYFDEPPCFIKVSCKTKDGKVHSDILIDKVKSKNSGELIMTSEQIKDFDYSDKVEILEVEFIENGR